MKMDISDLYYQYRMARYSPQKWLDETYPLLESSKKSNAWIHLLSKDEILKQINSLKGRIEELPLYGIPFAIKDNIDFSGVPTTAGCPDFSFVPKESAYVVTQLINAGAILIGKTNLDQFATGLVGVRSPYGVAVNTRNDKYIPGGSSSGSAVVVADELVSFSLGTDTAGSGRVPAAMNGIVGLKPTPGTISCNGVVPACKTLDCVSIFSRSLKDASQVFKVLCQKPDFKDLYYSPFDSKRTGFFSPHKKIKLAIPSTQSIEFYGCERSSQEFFRYVKMIEREGVEIHEIDYAPFNEAASLLYNGPWVSERYLACKGLIESKPESMNPVTRQIISKGTDYSSLSYFESEYKLRELRIQIDEMMSGFDALLTPTIPRPYKIEEVEMDPINLNSNLGHFTNFMNLLNRCAVAVPTFDLYDNLKASVTFSSCASDDFRLMNLVDHLNRQIGLISSESDSKDIHCFSDPRMDSVRVAVCGAHLSGYPLNAQIIERNGRLVNATYTSPFYRLFDLNEDLPIKRPGLIRDEENGDSIEVEVWEIPSSEFGSFVEGIPAPLGIGKCELISGDWVPGFICENIGLQNAIDITAHKGWRSYMQSLQ